MVGWQSIVGVLRVRKNRSSYPPQTSINGQIDEGVRLYQETNPPADSSSEPSSTLNGGARKEATKERSPVNQERTAKSDVNAKQDYSAQSSVLYRICVRIICWILWNIAFALLPLGFSAASVLGTGNSMSLDTALADGELVLISVALAGGSAGEIVDLQGPKGRIIRMLLLFGNLSICMVGTWLYSQITTLDWTRSMVTGSSLALFTAALITGICTIVRSEIR